MKTQLKNWAKSIDSTRRLKGKHQFTKRLKNHRLLVIILAGHKPELWPVVSTRLRLFTAKR